MDLQSNYPTFQQRNAQIIALAVHDMAGAQRVAEVAGAAFPLLADPDHKVADAYHVYNLLGDGIATPAVFIVDKQGVVVWSYIAKDAGDRPPSQTILQNLPQP